MRPLEILLTLSLFARPWLAGRGFRLANFIPGAAALAQLFIEGYRYQLLPLYVLALAFPLISLFREPNRVDTAKGSWKPAAAIGGSLLILLFAVPPIALPVPQTYQPTGPYPVGTRTLHLVDATRPDPYAPDPNTPREILVQIWYPAVDDGRAQTTPRLPHADHLAPAIAVWSGLPGFALDHLVYAQTAALQDVPMAEGETGWPVILFSHGYQGFRTQNTYQVVELASHGFVVIAVEHTYAAVLTVFPDGRIAPANPAALPSGLSDAEYEVAAERLLAQWSADLGFALDEVAARSADPGSWLHADLQRSGVGVRGHSTGAGAAFQFCSDDARCAAGLGMDPWLLPVQDQVLEDGLSQPFLVLFSESWASETNLAFFNTLSDGYPGDLTALTILGASHYDFSDLPQISPLSPYLGFKGPIDGDRMVSIVNSYSVDFFNAQLRGRTAALEYEGSSRYPEVVFGLPQGRNR